MADLDYRRDPSFELLASPGGYARLFCNIITKFSRGGGSMLPDPDDRTNSENRLNAAFIFFLL